MKIQTCLPMDVKILMKKSAKLKVWDFCPMVVNIKKKSRVKGRAQ
jgi:hypothetical protein